MTDILGIGNAIVDILSRCDDDFIESQNLTKGSMRLIGEVEAQMLYNLMGPAVEVSGGSAANTLVGASEFGAKTAYIARVRNDQFGKVFTHDLRSAGVSYQTPPVDHGPGTAFCLILVTPDGQRTMNTCLGASSHLSCDEIDEDLVASAKILFVEGYLWDQPSAKQAIVKAFELASRHGCKRTLTLSDSFCVHRHKAEFLDLLDNHIDILFANEAEAVALSDCEDVAEAGKKIAASCDILALTRSEKGSLIFHQGTMTPISPAPCKEVVDTTGAGDLYAGGFLAGLVQGASMERCGQMGSVAAAEVISHIGSRPEVSLAELLESSCATSSS